MAPAQPHRLDPPLRRGIGEAQLPHRVVEQAGVPAPQCQAAAVDLVEMVDKVHFEAALVGDQTPGLIEKLLVTELAEASLSSQRADSGPDRQGAWRSPRRPIAGEPSPPLVAFAPSKYCCPVRAMACYGHRGETTMNRAARGDGHLLSSDQLSRFQRDGYLLVEGVLEPAAVVEPLFAEYAEVLDRLARELHARGELASTYADLAFAERLIRIYRDTGRDHSRYFDPSLMTSGVTPDTPYWAGPAVFHIITHERVLDLVECLIGPEIYSNPVQHIRIKPPEHLLPDGATDVLARANPWHQDNGVVDPVADNTNMLTVWIALSDAPVERGCLQVIPRSHLQALRTHCPSRPGRPLAIPDTLLELNRATPVPTRAGDVILMHKHTIHGSLSNVSEQIRWSLDLRYNPTGQPTGRPEFPGFVARSRRDPERELRDPEAWARLWGDARERLAAHPAAKPAHRWRGTEPVCA